MRLFLKVFLGLLVLVGVALALRTDEIYSPSIASLKPNETLIMKYSACHSGCDKGTVRFQNNIAMMGTNKIEFTSQEVSELDTHFLSADSLEDDYFCSLRIMIGFEKKQAFRLSVRKRARLYPCVFGQGDQITPGGLIYHFNDRPGETPFWRLSPEEQAESLKIDLNED